MPPLSGSKSPPLRDLTFRQIQWIGAGYAMTLATMPGQTILIAQFNASIRETFGLSHGDFGLIYTLATLGSAVCLVFAGALADRIAPRILGIACIFGLASVAIAAGSTANVVMLVFVLFGLRFFGQGMTGHVAMTMMSRWFNRFRGRALSFAGFGFTTGEATMPFLITLCIASFGWRQVWFGTAGVLIIVFVPVIFFLLRDPPDGKAAMARGAVNPDAQPEGPLTGERWTRRTVMRDPLFFLIIPGVVGPPAIGTLFIFHQAHLVEMKGWDLTLFTAMFPVLAVTIVAASLTAGILVDRFSAWRLMPFILLPEGIGCIVIATLDPVWAIPLFFISFGLTGGTIAPVLGSLWAEIYGTAHIGSIRALSTSSLVLASAVGPGLAGVLIDGGVELNTQAWGYAAYCFAGCLLYVSLQVRFAERATSLRQQAEV